ncbi:MAG: hypothetical protein EBR33_12705, partial [Synechococcaceae bacterium WB4_1_0192]|nr:hypothetical protein [Synechococcaceae bacterium WB4_1_0192]
YELDQDKPSATVEMVRGSGEAETFVGCKVNTLQISGEAGGKEVPVQVGWVGMSSSGNGTATSLSQNSGVNVAVNPNSNTWTCTFGGSAVAGVRRFSVTLNNGLAGRRVLGSLAPDSVVADGFASVQAEFEIDYNSVAGDTYYDAWKAGTEGAVVFKMAATADLYVEITVQNARVTSVSRPAARMGYITETVQLIGQSRSGSPGLKFVVKNAQSSGKAA